jgi:phosphate transport system substrate-binding protein
MLYKSGNGPNVDALKKVFEHTLSDPAQADAVDLGFIPLPTSVLEQGRAALSTIQP